jgi:hypothetical protein
VEHLVGRVEAGCGLDHNAGSGLVGLALLQVELVLAREGRDSSTDGEEEEVKVTCFFFPKATDDPVELEC